MRNHPCTTFKTGQKYVYFEIYRLFAMRQDKRPDPFEIFILAILVIICSLFFAVTNFDNLIFIPFVHYDPFAIWE